MSTEQIISKNVSDAYVDDMARYSIETNRRRAFPDYRDGLKLVQRRTLYAMAFDIKTHTPIGAKLEKTAQVVGRVMGELHPHGDSSIEGVAMNLARWWDNYIPLIYSESNIGNMQGGKAAHMRYTEVMLSDFAKDVIFSEMKETPNIVDWTPTYSGDRIEPKYLPVKVPLLLINGIYGIGTGKATSIPSHNINEVIDATVALIDNPDAPVVLVPDQCMPCEIIEANWKRISNSGNGTFKVRGIIDIEVADKGKSNEHYVLVVKSIPDGATLNDGKDTGIHYQINNLISEGKLPQITDIVEDSHGRNLRYQIHLKKGSDPNYVRDFLYKATLLQKAQTVNFEVLNGIEPMARMSYKSYLQAFLEQRNITKYRYYCLKLQDIRTQLHEREICIMFIKSGKAAEMNEKIKKSKAKNDSDLVEWLVKLFNITDLQARFILNYPSKKWAPFYLKQYENEAKMFREKEKEYIEKILNNNLIMEEIKQELLDIKAKYGFPRKSRVISQSEILDIPQGTFNIVVTENNYIKKLPTNENIGAYKGDKPVLAIRAENTSDIIFMTAQGRGFRFPIHKIPITEKNSIGIDIRVLIKGISSGVVAMFDAEKLKTLASLRKKHYAVIVTKYNYIKKLDINDILISTPSGIIMTKLNQNDSVKDVIIAPNKNDIVIYSKKKALRCKMESIPNYKRNTLGVYAMKTNDEIDGISIINPSDTDIVVITELGKINKFDISGLPLADRYTAGNRVMKLGKTDSIVSIFSVTDINTIKVVTKNTVLDIPVKDISRTSSISPGTKMIPLKGDVIVKCVLE